MFIYSIRGETIKFFSVITMALMLLVFMVNVGEATIPTSVGGITVDYGGIDTKEKQIAFIESQGLKVKGEPVIDEVFIVPDSFDRIIGGYNEIQKAQGLDLNSYKGKRVTHYAYEVTNYNHDGVVYVNLYLHKSRIVACDISSLDGKGFVTPLVTSNKDNLK